MSKLNKTTLAERIVDNEVEHISLRDIASRLFLRPKLLVLMLLLPPLVAMLFSAMVPVEWAASTKVLIRYGSSENSQLRDLVPDAKLGISGATTAELIKSDPVIEQTIRRVGITADDVYQKPKDIIMGKIFNPIKAIFSSDDSSKNTKSGEEDITPLVKSFQASLQSSSKKSSSNSVEILEKTSTVPDALKLDELITIQVKSFNREKVAQMANGLVASFIDEYYRIYQNEAAKEYAYLDELVAKEEKELSAIEMATPADFEQGKVVTTGGRELISRDVPILSGMANQLMDIEAELVRAKQIYANGAPQVARLSKQVGNLKFQLKKQELIEIGKQQLEHLKTKRYQAANRQKVYQERLVPITIAEAATTPGPSSSKKISRIIISGIIGAILSVMMATGVMVILNILDPRIHFARDLQKLTEYPLLASIPFLKDLHNSNVTKIRSQANLEQLLLQVIPVINQAESRDSTKVVVIGGVGQGAGASVVSVALASIFGKNKSERVCLIDADFNGSSITQMFDLQKEQGLIDALLNQSNTIAKVDSLNISIMGIGNQNALQELGYYSENAARLLEEIKEDFSYILIDAGSVLSNNELPIFGALADVTILVAESGESRKGKLREALFKLDQANVNIAGLILNKTKNTLPDFIYNTL